MIIGECTALGDDRAIYGGAVTEICRYLARSDIWGLLHSDLKS